jgi:hypothetical protein
MSVVLNDFRLLSCFALCVAGIVIAAAACSFDESNASRARIVA